MQNLLSFPEDIIAIALFDILDNKTNMEVTKGYINVIQLYGLFFNKSKEKG